MDFKKKVFYYVLFYGFLFLCFPFFFEWKVNWNLISLTTQRCFYHIVCPPFKHLFDDNLFFFNVSSERDQGNSFLIFRI